MAKKPKVFVTRKLPAGLDLLEEETELKVSPEDRVLERKELIDHIKGQDALLCSLADRIDAEVMDAGEHLKVISNYAVGFDNIEVAEATKRGIAVTNTPGVLTETTAELVWALLMAVARRIAEADRFLRSGKWQGWAPMLFLGRDIWGKVLGIVGLGRIGTAVAKRAKGFNMEILYYSPRRKQKLERELGVEYVPLEELLRRSDFVTLHMPLLPDTYHLIGERELELMKTTAFLINASRGPVVDENALIKALQEGKIAGAALDVYEKEPEVPSALKELSNAVLVPHIGSASVETRTKMAMVAIENLLAVLKGKVPQNLVNPEVIKRLGLKVD